MCHKLLPSNICIHCQKRPIFCNAEQYVIKANAKERVTLKALCLHSTIYPVKYTQKVNSIITALRNFLGVHSKWNSQPLYFTELLGPVIVSLRFLLVFKKNSRKRIDWRIFHRFFLLHRLFQLLKPSLVDMTFWRSKSCSRINVIWRWRRCTAVAYSGIHNASFRLTLWHFIFPHSSPRQIWLNSWRIHWFSLKTECIKPNNSYFIRIIKELFMKLNWHFNKFPRMLFK